MDKAFLNTSLSLLIVSSILLGACTSSDSALNGSETSSAPVNAYCTETLTPGPNLPAGDVLSLVRSEEGDPASYAFAVEHDAEIIPVDSNVSYAVWWQPEGFDASTDTVVVSLGGHGGWAVKDFEVWYPQLTQRNVAYLGLQWWFGRSLEDEGYYEPDRIYSLLAEQLESKGVTPGNVIFTGFSMSSARSYGISLYDHLCGENYFGVNIANSGQWEDDYPLYADILTKDYGEHPFEGTTWILFCGEKDNNEEAHGGRSVNTCEGMTKTQQRLEDMGAIVDLFIKDPEGDHGSFMLDSDNVNEAMDEAEAILGSN